MAQQVELNEDSSYYLETNELVTIEYKHPGLDVDFPSEWFAKQDNTKPTAVVPRFNGQDEELIRAVKGGIRAAGLTLPTAKQFMYRYCTRIGVVLGEQWESFGRVICDPRERVTPWSIVTITEGPAAIPTETMLEAHPRAGQVPPDDPHSWTQKAMMMFILCIYRLAKVQNEEYSENLRGRLEAQIKAEGGAGMSLHGAKGLYGSWLNDSGFLKMIAAIDMFFHKCKNHPDAMLRIGSLTSRFRDCAALLSMGYAMSILNIKAGTLMDWVFIKAMAIEVNRVATRGQESGKTDSYFPYQSDMGIVTKSAYSSNANPYLHTWIHMIGALLGHQRSINARYIFEGNLADISLNAVLITWAFARGGELNPQFSRRRERYGDDIMPEEEDDEGDAGVHDTIWVTTQGREAQTWYALLKNGGFKIPGVVSKVIRRQRDKIRNPREDTIGEYVKNNFLY
ncbi:unnamed protein product [Euphydryas editha]|uniref:Rhabdovirus nucleocapsid domain-containing protein n=1 Tax=Euphydryas editha TaxID=104508 RepID=A0AAU9TRP0_EUPED|nr:unnamed protein product [Euphydryas editha]